MVSKTWGIKIEFLQGKAEKTPNKSTNSNNKKINVCAFKFCPCECYKLVLTGKMFTSQSQDRLIRSVQAWLLPPVSSVLAPELGKSRITLLGQHFLNTNLPRFRSLPSETATRLWIQQLTDVSSHIICHPVCVSPTRHVVGDRDHPLRSEVIFSEMLRIVE